MATRTPVQRTLALLATLTLALPAAAQGPAAFTYPLEHGRLRVWIIRPLTPSERLIRNRQRAIAAGAVTLPTTVQGQTTGGFGQTAGSFGQTAGSYGQTTENLGQTSSSAGQTAGSYGQSVSQLGTASSNVGQTAGSYQGSIPSLNSLQADQAAQPDAGPRDPLSRRSAELLAELQGQFPAGRLQFQEIPEDSFRDIFLGASRESLPDVILDPDALPDWWNASTAGLTMLGWPPPSTQGPGTAPQGPGAAQERVAFPSGPEPVRLHEATAAILRNAPHPAEARAFVVWLRDDGLCRRCEDPDRGFLANPKTATPASLARDALGRLLTGNEPGAAADPAAARANPLLVQSLTLLPAGSEEPLPAFNLKLDVLNAVANDRLAEVALRGIVAGPDAFGVVHALVVLRRNGDGDPWKVLQVTANLLPRQLIPQGAELLPFLKPDPPARVAGIVQAAPVDGDNRQPHPDLWWDNGGGDGLLVVEWQVRYDTEWSDAHLMMVPDRESRAQTRVDAAFADGGEYRWRVWAVGTGGALVLSPWRRFFIVP